MSVRRSTKARTSEENRVACIQEKYPRQCSIERSRHRRTWLALSITKTWHKNNCSQYRQPERSKVQHQWRSGPFSESSSFPEQSSEHCLVLRLESALQYYEKSSRWLLETVAFVHRFLLRTMLEVEGDWRWIDALDIVQWQSSAFHWPSNREKWVFWTVEDPIDGNLLPVGFDWQVWKDYPSNRSTILRSLVHSNTPDAEKHWDERWSRSGRSIPMSKDTEEYQNTARRAHYR